MSILGGGDYWAYNHLPKCGGTSVEKAIMEAGWASDFNIKGHHIHTCAFMFTFVRNPVDWWKSLWGYNIDEGTSWEGIPRPDTDSEAWIEKTIREKGALCSKAFIEYTTGCSFIGTVENLQADLDIVAAKLDLPRAVVGNFNASKTSQDNVLTAKTIVLIEEVEEEAFAIWRKAS